MSFLNPVSEPVKRFSSTDAGAPQINYNARVAGDVKTVLKACLVTGYGAKASAGWSIVNEVDHVAEFVSPSVAMSDYRLGIDDTSASSTTWYYQYQDARVNPTYNAPIKSINAINKTSAENGWQLFVTDLGILLLETFMNSYVNKLSNRITYLGQAKSALIDNTGVNICFFNTGHSGALGGPEYLYTSMTHIKLGVYNGTLYDSTPMLTNGSQEHGISSLDLVSSIYIRTNSALLGQLPPFMSGITNQRVDAFGVSVVTLDSREMLKVSAGYASYNGADESYRYDRTYFISTDYWEY